MIKADIQISEHRLVSFDRTVLFYRRIKPLSGVKASLLIVHGMGEHGGRYLDLARYLAEACYDLWVPDMRGYGQSGGARGCIKQFSDHFRDLDAVVHLIRSQTPRTKHFLVGHSFGGLITFHYLAQRPEALWQGFILSSPLFGLATPVSWIRHQLACLSSYIAPNLTQLNRVNPTYLSHDRKAVLKYKSDRLVHPKISSRLYREMSRYMQNSLSSASQLKTPALVLQAGDDRIVRRSLTEKVFHGLSSPDKTLEIYDGFYHEILNEENSGLVYERILSWLECHL